MNRADTISARVRAHQPALVGLGVLGLFAVALLGTHRFGLPVWSLLVPIAGAAYVMWVLHRPYAGLFIVICVFFLPIRIGGVTLLQSVGVLTAGIVALWFLRQRRAPRFGNIVLPLLLIGVLIVVSTMFTRDVERTMHYFRKWGFNLVFVLILTNLVTDFRVFKRVVWAVILMASLNAAVGIWDFAVSQDLRYRSVGMLENANEFGNLAALAFPLALYQYLYQKGGVRWIGLGLSVLCAGGVIVSVSRGALTAMLVVFCAICYTERRRLAPLALVVVLAVVSTPILPDYFYERVQTIATDVKGTVLLGESEDLTVRGHYNKGALRIFMAHPIFGVGIGNFGKYFVEREFNPGTAASTEVAVHNIYVQALAEFGLTGLAVLLWLIYITFRNVLYARRAHRGDVSRWLYFGGVEMMALTVFIATFSTGNLISEDFWLLVGLAAVSSQVADDRRDSASRLAESPVP